MAEAIAPADGDDSAAYCADLVRRCDEDRWLGAHYAPPALKRSLLALAAFACEIRRIPDAVSEAPLGEIRLQWWRDAFEELRAGKPPRAHPVVAEIAAAALYRADLAALVECAIDARARVFYDRTFADIDALHDWLAASEGVFDRLAARLAAADEDMAGAAGAAFALARDGGRYAPPMRQSAGDKARALYADNVMALKSVEARAAPALLHLSLTPLYIRRAGPFPVAKRLRLFGAMALSAF